jgi:hypothetical protein
MLLHVMLNGNLPGVHGSRGGTLHCSAADSLHDGASNDGVELLLLLYVPFNSNQHTTCSPLLLLLYLTASSIAGFKAAATPAVLEGVGEPLTVPRT